MKNILFFKLIIVIIFSILLIILRYLVIDKNFIVI